MCRNRPGRGLERVARGHNRGGERLWGEEDELGGGMDWAQEGGGTDRGSLGQIQTLLLGPTALHGLLRFVPAISLTEL